MLLLPFAALAAEPDLNGVHLALGAGVATRATPDEALLGSVSPALRVHLGPAWMVEALASGGVIRQSDTFTYDLADGSDANDGDTEEVRGWTAAAEGRISRRVFHVPALDVYAGLGATWERLEASGDLSEPVIDEETGEVTSTVVGRVETASTELSGEVTVTLVRWITEDVSLSGLVTVPVFERAWTMEEEYLGEGDAAVLDAVNEDLDTFVGATPVVGLYAHVRF